MAMASSNYALVYNNNLGEANYADMYHALNNNEDVQSVHSYSSSHQSVTSSSTRSKRAIKLETKSKFSNKSTSIYKKNKALRHMNEGDNESSSVLLAEALGDLAIA